MANNQSLVGNIDLSALNGARLETTAGGNQTVVIPVSGNSFWKAFSSNTSLRLLFHVARVLTSPVSLSI